MRLLPEPAGPQDLASPNFAPRVLTALLRPWRTRTTEPVSTPVEASTCATCPAPCDEHGAATGAQPCPLMTLPKGVRARVVAVGCPMADASRLRCLGVFEGAQVSVVDRRGGILLDVRGSRLALDAAVAATIIALPLAN